MRLMKLEELTGEEKLARSIMTDDYKELLSQGSTVKLEYIPKLKDIGIASAVVSNTTPKGILDITTTPFPECMKVPTNLTLTSPFTSVPRKNC